eukprot:UN01028
MSFIFPTPRGFHPICELINMLSPDKTLFQTFYEASQQKTKDLSIQQTLLQLVLKSPELKDNKAVQTWTVQNVQNIIDTFAHIAVSLKKKIDTASQQECATILQDFTVLTDETIQLIIPLLFASKDAKTNNAAADTGFTIGKIVDTQYKIGLAISSSDCEKLYEPFVTLSMTVDKPHEGQRLESFELSVAEFHRLQITLNEIKQAMDDML